MLANQALCRSPSIVGLQGQRRGYACVLRSLLDAVDLVGSLSNVGARLPDEIQLLLLALLFFLCGNLGVRVNDGLPLVKLTLESVAILEVPGTFAHGLVVLEVSLPVEAVRVDPLSGLHLALLPGSNQFHACFLKNIGAVTLLLTEAPPARINITGFLIGEDTFSVALTVLPVTMVLTDVVVDHLADAVSSVGLPLALVLVALLEVTVDTTALSVSVEEVALIDVLVLVGGSTLASETSGCRFDFAILSHELILGSFFSFFSHPASRALLISGFKL